MKLLCLLPLALAAADPNWVLYRATIAAADGALRLNETASAHHWLEIAPPPHRGWEWRYLNAIADVSSFTVKAHDAPITGIAVSPDGKLAATTSGDGSVRLHATEGREPYALLAGHTAASWSPAFRPDGAYLASMGSDGTVRVWSVGDKKETRQYGNLGRGMGAVAWSADGRYLAAGSWSVEQGRGVVGWLHLWDFEKDELLWKSEYGVKPIVTLAFHPARGEFLAGTWDGIVGAFPVEGRGTPRVEVRLKMGDGVYSAVQQVSFLPGGGRFLVAAKDSLLHEYDAGTGQHVRDYTGHAAWVNAAAGAGSWLASASSDETIRLWNHSTGALLRPLRGHQTAIRALALTPGGQWLLSGDADGNLRWWKASLADLSASEWRHDGNVYGLAFSPRGDSIASAAWGGSITVRDPRTGAVRWSKAVHETSANAVAYSPDGARLVSGGNDGRLILTDAANGEPLATWEQATQGRAAAIAWSPNGATVFCPSDRSTGKLWDAANGKALRTVTGGTGEIYAAAFSPDSRWLLAGWTGGQIGLIDAASGAQQQVTGSSGAIHAVAFHPSGKSFATAGADRRIRLWEMPTGRLLRTLEGHSELVFRLSYSPDGSRLVSASTDQSVRLWDAATGDSLLRIPFPVQVYTAVFSPDGSQLAVAPMDGRVVILEAPQR